MKMDKISKGYLLNLQKVSKLQRIPEQSAYYATKHLLLYKAFMALRGPYFCPNPYLFGQGFHTIDNPLNLLKP